MLSTLQTVEITIAFKESWSTVHPPAVAMALADWEIDATKIDNSYRSLSYSVIRIVEIILRDFSNLPSNT